MGNWLGQWFGSGEPAPAGALSGTAALSVTAAGTTKAVGHLSGTASLSLSCSGEVTGASVSCDVRVSWLQFDSFAIEVDNQLNFSGGPDDIVKYEEDHFDRHRDYAKTAYAKPVSVDELHPEKNLSYLISPVVEESAEAETKSTAIDQAEMAMSIAKQIAADAIAKAQAIRDDEEALLLLLM